MNKQQPSRSRSSTKKSKTSDPNSNNNNQARSRSKRGVVGGQSKSTQRVRSRSKKKIKSILLVNNTTTSHYHDDDLTATNRNEKSEPSKTVSIYVPNNSNNNNSRNECGDKQIDSPPHHHQQQQHQHRQIDYEYRVRMLVEEILRDNSKSSSSTNNEMAAWNEMELVKRSQKQLDDENYRSFEEKNSPPPSPSPSSPNKSAFHKNRSTLKLIVIVLVAFLVCHKIVSMTNLNETISYYLKAILLLVSFCFLFRLFYLNLAPLCSSSTQILFYGTISFLSLLGLLLVFIMFFFGCIFLNYCKLNINLNYSTHSSVFAGFELHQMFSSIF